MLLTGTRIFTKSPLFVAPFSYSLFYEYRDVHRCLSHWPGRPVGEGAGLMNYSVLPPEINSLRMFTGAGSAPMLAAPPRNAVDNHPPYRHQRPHAGLRPRQSPCRKRLEDPQKRPRRHRMATTTTPRPRPTAHQSIPPPRENPVRTRRRRTTLTPNNEDVAGRITESLKQMRTDPSAQPAPEQPIAAATSFYPSTNMTPWSRVSTDLISSLLVGAVEAQHAADGRRVLAVLGLVERAARGRTS